MKTSLQQTEYLLIKTMTNSEWDNGDFAIIASSLCDGRIRRTAFTV